MLASLPTVRIPPTYFCYGKEAMTCFKTYTKKEGGAPKRMKATEIRTEARTWASCEAYVLTHPMQVSLALRAGSVTLGCVCSRVCLLR